MRDWDRDCYSTTRVAMQQNADADLMPQGAQSVQAMRPTAGPAANAGPGEKPWRPEPAQAGGGSASGLA